MLRNSSAVGKVCVTGLRDEPIVFSPNSTEKIEDFWDESNRVMPLNMSRLLVVKGADLNLVDNKLGGIDQTVIRELLSNIGELDKIRAKISQTVQNASLENSSIIGTNQGEIKSIRQFAYEIEHIDKLYKEIDNLYSSGYRASLEDRINQLEAAINDQKKAKKHNAYQLASELQVLKQQRKILTREDINQIRKINLEFKVISKRIYKNQAEIRALEPNVQNYNWITSAIKDYENYNQNAAISKNRIFPLAAIFLAFVSLGFLYAIIANLISPSFGYLGAISAIVLATALGWLFFIQQENKVRKSFEIFQENQIARDFKQRFGQPLHNLAQMEAIREQLQPNYYRSFDLEKEITEDRKEIELINTKMGQRMDQIGWADDIPEDYDSFIVKLEKQLEELEQKIHQKEIDFSKLGIDQSEFTEIDPGIEFQSELLETLLSKLNRIEKQKVEEDHKLSALKQKICMISNDDITIKWDLLLQNLRASRQEKIKAYHELCAKIVAGILVSKEIECARNKEDKRLLKILASEAFTKSLKQITGRYEQINLHDERLFVSDQFNQYPISDLSTGTQEQVLLAIRLGIAKVISGEEQLFLILDDAFQHADWERRRYLLNELITMAKMGWQIIYLTMDDHIKKLFLKHGSKVFKQGMTYTNLENHLF